jgi:hypothetical protein
MVPDAVWADYFTITQTRAGWRKALDRWNIGVVVAIRQYQGRLIHLLEEDAGWIVREQDAEGVVFTRSSQT